MSLSLALVDSLTGLYNRRYLEVHLQKLIQKNEPGSKTLGVLIMDIDHFKEVNDQYGHGVGDEILKIFGERLQYNIRGFDMAARMGGEEFAIILPDVSEDMAYHISERLRRAICDEPFKCGAPGGQINVTTSIGGALIRRNDQTVEEVLKRADTALYAAKEAGRNATFFEKIGRIDPDKYKAELRKAL